VNLEEEKGITKEIRRGGGEKKKKRKKGKIKSPKEMIHRQGTDQPQQ
jgi:hypothetical protein